MYLESCSLLNGLSKSSIALFQAQIHKLFEESDCNLSSHMSRRHLLSRTYERIPSDDTFQYLSNHKIGNTFGKKKVYNELLVGS